jgi:hypothetical protein
MTEFDPNFDPEKIRAAQDIARGILKGWEAEDAKVVRHPSAPLKVPGSRRLLSQDVLLEDESHEASG